jgi:AAA+ superfamily predicted ATPase
VSPWERYGRLFAERDALAARRHGEAAGVLTPAELAVLTGAGEQRAGTRQDVLTAFEPVLGEARKEFLAELEGEGPLARMARYADLAEPDATVLALVAAVELSEETARLVGGRGDTTGLTLGAVRRMLGDLGAVALAEDSALCRAALVTVGDGPLASAAVRLGRRTAWALLGDLSLDPDLPASTDVALAAGPSGAMRVLAAGPDRVRRIEAAVGATRGLGFLVGPPPADERGWVALVSQASVAGVGLVLDLPAPAAGADPLPLTARRWLERALHLPVALASPVPLPLESLPAQEWVEATAGPAHVTAAEWTEQYDGAPLPGRRPAADQLRAMSVLAGTTPELALHRLAAGTLHQHARRVVPTKTWADLVLPPVQERRLRELVARYRQRARVHEEWGLDLYPSPGVVALFSGPSGTGKTTSAEVIAGELGVDLFRIDLSALVSKYIGETEKNLEEIFSAAHAGDYLLLFDEADSLFGQRSAVTDARDRYANMEVSYLLQRLETYDGFVVLTSNFQGNIDDAFLRRIHAAVHFPMPTATDRERIWARSLAAAPLAEADLGFLATRFELTGGSIRNAALTAAFLAADRGDAVGMPDLLTAVAQELTKLKQRVTPDMFGQWAGVMADPTRASG